MLEWLTVKSLFGAPRWIFLALALAAIVAGVAMFNHRVDKTLETVTTTAREAGASTAIAAGQKVTLDQVGAANEASIDYRSDAGLGRYCECLRDSAEGTAGNCVRYLRNKPVPGGPAPGGAYCPGP